jgi:diguanylate cyclase (GGDEF)-like protein
MRLLPLLFAGILALGLRGGVPVAGPEPQGRFTFTTYGPEQGLMDPALYTLVQDREGFLWIASDNGLIRYDGAAFRKWTTADGLPSSFILSLLPMPRGGLWVATDKGVVRFKDGKITPLLLGGKPFIIRGALMQLDADGVLWLFRDDGLYCQKGDGAVERMPGTPTGWGKSMATRAGTRSVFLAVAKGLWERRADGTMVDWSAAKGLTDDPIEVITVDGNGRLWVVGTHSLAYLDPAETVFHDVSAWLPAGPFRGCIIHVNPDGSVAIPTNAGLLRLKGNEHDLVDQSLGLPGKWAVSSLVDREGNLWIVGPRIYRMLGRGYVRGFTSLDGLPSDMVWAVYRDRLGRLWAGTGDGAALLGPGGWSRVPGTEGLSVSALVLDDQDRLWIGSNNRMPLCLEPGQATATERAFRSYRLVGGGTVPSRSTSMVLDRQGGLRVGDPGHGVYRIDFKAGTLVAEFGAAEAKTTDLGVVGMDEDAQGRLWVATTVGLALRDGTGWHRWTRAEGLRDDTLQGLRVAPDGTCWVTYQEALGLTRVGFKDGKFQVLEQLDGTHGITSDRVYSVGTDRQGTLWVGTDRGVDRLRKGQTFHLSQGGGLPGEDCSGNALLTETNGEIWVGTSTGLAHILPDHEPMPLHPMPVYIQQIMRGKTMQTPPFGELPPLSHRDRTLEFRFACPTYINERAVIYQVRLLGLEEEWRSSDVPQARYTALPAGSYRFEVRAAYPGQAFGPVASYEVEVLGPWWRSWWFLALATLGGAGLVGLFVNWRLRTLASQKARLALLVDQRTSDLVKANQNLETANLALKAQSLTDPLTGLHNRRFLSVVVDDDIAAVARAYRDTAPGMALPNQDLIFLMVDLDHFKQVNDRFGHATGDRVLELVATALRKAARETDAVIRWGGEEFLVMARNASRSEGHLLAERIRSIMAEQQLTLDSGEVLTWTCSVGFAAYPWQLEDVGWMGWERLVEIADACLYLAKKAGRDGWVGAQAGTGMERAAHGARLPWELLELREEGVVDMQASRADTFRRAPRTGEIFG